MKELKEEIKDISPSTPQAYKPEKHSGASFPVGCADDL